MKKIISFLVYIMTVNPLFMAAPHKIKFMDITANFSLEEFETVKRFVLNRGDRKTYRNRDSNNPHYRFDGFDLYLNAKNSRNINSDPEISDFDEITIYDSGKEIQYYTLKIIHKSDSQDKKTLPEEGMNENRVYLLNHYEKNIRQMKKNLIEIYFKKIKSGMVEVP